ncbi:MAG: hypothetical protein SF052_15080 [Bacteroidia bacterium]|nr:hypothetical protein [Bacteroidia bacterium]
MFSHLPFPQSNRTGSLLIALFCFLYGFPTSILATVDGGLKVYLNCSSCDHSFIKSEITYVDYVRDQSLADVQIFITRMTTGSGGGIYEMNFTGYNEFGDIKHQIRYEVLPTSTSDLVRKGLVKRIEAGLMLFLANTPLADEIKISVPVNNRVTKEEKPQHDPWDHWVFSIYGDGNFSKETSKSAANGELGFRADRVTELWRVRTNGEVNHLKNKFFIDNEEVISVRDRNYFSGSLVRSISNHWSAGFFTDLAHNSYQNLDFTASSMPAIEYSIFPYTDVNRKELTAVYQMGYVYNNYLEQTIYEKNQEHLFRQTMALTARFNETWGNIFSRLEASNYMHDFSKRSLQLDSYVSVRVFKGLSARVSTNLDLVQDQINLPRRDATLEEILLQQRQLATNFNMGFGMGLSYTFGSMYNNIINTRL